MTGPRGTPLDLHAALEHWAYHGPLDSRAVAAAALAAIDQRDTNVRALRAALEAFLQSCPYHDEEARVEYWLDIRERAAAVLAQAQDRPA